MIKIRNKKLPQSAAKELATFQALVDAEPSYAKQVARAKSEFSKRNKKGTEPFDTVKRTLTAMCSGAKRCMYCEDSVADEVEHFKPKDLYPELVFVWKNYLYACGPCNGPKNNKFAVIEGATSNVVDVARKPKAKVVKPVTGKPALIDPRVEDPLKFLSLDIVDTFEFSELSKPGTVEYERAKYTIEILRLLSRDYLRDARETQYTNYESNLRTYINRRDAQAPQAELKRIIRAIKRSPHPTVWAEMKRKRALIPELDILFKAAPEALNW